MKRAVFSPDQLSPWKKRAIGYFFFTFLALLGCTDPYTPATTNINYQYLVIDGILDTGGDTIRFNVSTTRTLSTSSGNGFGNGIAPVVNATVTIDELGGQSWTMQSDLIGNYSLAPGLVDASKQLRMHISYNGKEYASAYVMALATPPIDTVAWKLTTINADSVVQLSISTHDPSNTIKYYRWQFEETWKYTSALPSGLIRDGDEIRGRNPDEDISRCYKSDSSRLVLINSTTNLTQDVVSNVALTTIPRFSFKLSNRYSINVHQYALTKEGYNFWGALQKNTENLGSIFGSLPVQVTGNFTCLTDPSIPVIGFFSATAVQNKRIFIDNLDLPPGQYPDSFYNGCAPELVSVEAALQNTTELYLYGKYERLVLVGYYLGTTSCSDCREHGGTLTVPSFWQ